MQNYFYRDKASQEIGPLALDALAKLRFAGVLDGDTPVRAADSAEWKPCREIIADPSQPLPSHTSAAPVAKSPLSPVLIALVILGVLVYGGMTLYKSVAAKTALTFGISIDGKKNSIFNIELSSLQTPEVKVDGQPFLSGQHIRPGRHQISIRMDNVEPYEQHFWVLFGTKNFGNLPLQTSKGSLLVTVNPSPATVIVQRGREVIRQGNAPLDEGKLPLGDYTLIIHRGEYEETRSANIQREQQTKVQVDLNLGSADLSANPADADFELSGNGRHWQGKLPTKIEDVPTGNYILAISRKGWELNQDISINRGSVTTNKTEFQYGSIEVTSDPTGLAVSTNGVEIGKTPLTLREVKPGQYILAVSDGENDLLANLSVGPKEAVKHAFVFHYGAVQLSSTPPGATVVRKGKEVGKTPLALNHIPIGESSVELRLDGYASTNFIIRASEGATANLSVKLISEQYLQAMQKAHDAFDAGKFADSRTAISAALTIEPNDSEAIKLQAKIGEAEQNAEKARLEAEQKKAMENRLVYEQQFQQLTASVQDSGMFVTYSREYSSDFDKVWNAVINVLKQQADKIARSNQENGLIMTDLTRHGLIGFPHYDRYLLLVERIDSNTTKINLKLMMYWVDFSNSMTGIQRPQGGVFYQNHVNDFWGKIGRELNAH